MMNAVTPATHMTSNRSLGRVYMMGGVNPNTHDPSTGTQGAVDIIRSGGGGSSATILVSGDGAVREAGLLSGAKSGLVEVVAGADAIDGKYLDMWGDPFAVPDNGPCHFRQTGGCSGTGPRQPAGDKPCDTIIPCGSGSCPSGYCECKGGVKKHPVSCTPGSHAAFTCAEFCAHTAEPTSAAVAATGWSTSAMISPNNRNFPASQLITNSSNLPSGDLAAVMTGIYGSAPGCLCTFPNSPACPGMEGKGEKLGQIATTVARSDRGYAGTYNYFDPDNFFSMTALIYSGEPFLQEQARTVIERSGSFLCIGDVGKSHKCTYGQLPHHFVGDTPTFLALSGATQTGPNTFWVKSALQYARNSGNLAWLKSYMPTLRAAAAFCTSLHVLLCCVFVFSCAYSIPFFLFYTIRMAFSLYAWLMYDAVHACNQNQRGGGTKQNTRALTHSCTFLLLFLSLLGFDLINPENHMLLAPGSLMIDVFIRQNYTSDSNAMMVGFLNEFADAEEAIGNTTGAAALRAESTSMAAAVNKYLWDGTDHYVTQVNPDDMDCAQTHSCRDFVDYDSNLIAVAHAIPTTAAQGAAVLKRIDTGIQKCTALQGGGPQWTSEIWYGPHDTTSGNVGDSSSAMGRIAWFDSKARKVVGDVKGFDTYMAVMQKDLLTYTWMHERYNCDGKMAENRTAAYFEYPSTVAIMLREIRYGIELGFGHVAVAPMPNTAFNYHIGNVNVDYNPSGTTYIKVPPSGANGADREFRFAGMHVNATYVVDAAADCAEARAMSVSAELHASVATDTAGVLKFKAFAHCGISITLK